MSSFPTVLDVSTTNIAGVELNSGESEAVQQLSSQGYEVHFGLTPDMADAIIAMALEAGIKEYCPNDSGSRFADRQSVDSWLSKGRATFLLLKKTGDGHDLVGYGWTGDGTSEHVPGGQTTFAIRIGQAGQGQGLATPFARLIVYGSAKIYGASKFWLETWASNAGAVHVYHKIGFQDVDQQAGTRPTADGNTVEDIRLYMSLPDTALV